MLYEVITIGLLKALGANNRTVKRIFLYQSFFLIAKGLFWGNLLGIGLCWLQYKTQLISLNQTSYFIDYVPINLTAFLIIATNLGSLLFIFLAMFLPSLIILRIDPVKTLRYS